MTEGLAAALQVRLRTLAFLFFILCSVVYLFVDIGTCSSYISSWLGFLPMQASSGGQVLRLAVDSVGLLGCPALILGTLTVLLAPARTMLTSTSPVRAAIPCISPLLRPLVLFAAVCDDLHRD